jgi:DNA-damage-inducible protein J
MGLSISDAIRLLMLRIADERRLPFVVEAPNRRTRKAMAELKAGKGRKFKNVGALMADLNARDWSIGSIQARLQARTERPIPQDSRG